VFVLLSALESPTFSSFTLPSHPVTMLRYMARKCP
jgi:hypothetical protein